MVLCSQECFPVIYPGPLPYACNCFQATDDSVFCCANKTVMSLCGSISRWLCKFLIRTECVSHQVYCYTVAVTVVRGVCNATLFQKRLQEQQKCLCSASQHSQRSRLSEQRRSRRVDSTESHKFNSQIWQLIVYTGAHCCNQGAPAM